MRQVCSVSVVGPHTAALLGSKTVVFAASEPPSVSTTRMSMRSFFLAVNV